MDPTLSNAGNDQLAAEIARRIALPDAGCGFDAIDALSGLNAAVSATPDAFFVGKPFDREGARAQLKSMAQALADSLVAPTA